MMNGKEFRYPELKYSALVASPEEIQEKILQLANVERSVYSTVQLAETPYRLVRLLGQNR